MISLVANSCKKKQAGSYSSHVMPIQAGAFEYKRALDDASL